MKRGITVLMAALLLLLSTGCTAMLERSYISATAHVDYDALEDDPSVLRAETYQSLVNSILYFVEAHSATGTIRLYNYTGDVEADLASACAEVLNEDPLGAYAVRDIRYDTTRIVTYYEVNISIIYSRSAQEVNEIRSVTGLTSLRSAIAEAVQSWQDHAAIRISYFSWTQQYVEELFWQAYYSNPLCALPGTEAAVTLYPDNGTQRIVDISISWPQSMSSMVDRSRELSRTAGLLLDENPPAEDTYTVEELAVILGAAVTYSADGSSDPLDVLTGIPADDAGLLLTMELLCQQAEIEATMAFGVMRQETLGWLIVACEDGYRHLLPQDLSAVVNGATRELPLYTDEALRQEGYTWQSSLYPVCGT